MSAVDDYLKQFDHDVERATIRVNSPPPPGTPNRAKKIADAKKALRKAQQRRERAYADSQLIALLRVEMEQYRNAINKISATLSSLSQANLPHTETHVFDSWRRLRAINAEIGPYWHITVGFYRLILKQWEDERVVDDVLMHSIKAEISNGRINDHLKAAELEFALLKHVLEK